jgi:BCD family chlorophyll transporter-like MFS transporter
MNNATLGWIGIARLGLVQAALGSIVVLTTSTLNRIMVVELALPAILPGLLVAMHYCVQVLRPRMGHGSDVGGRSTPWIIGGMAVLGLGGFGAAVATAWMGSNPVAGIALAILAFLLGGIGVSASGTSLLVLLAKRVEPGRRAAAATIVWLMMIAGFAVTAVVAGRLLDPYSPARMIGVSGAISFLAFCLTLIVLRNVEGRVPVAGVSEPKPAQAAKSSFREALLHAWNDPQARRFTIFVFVSMLAFSAQDLILEPFAGLVFGFTPGQSTSLSGIQHAGVLVGMLLVAFGGSRLSSLRLWMCGGCVASAIALLGLTISGMAGPGAPLRTGVFALGIANGTFSIAAIGFMMNLAGAGKDSREGVRMGLWGAAQAIAFGLGGFLGTAASDVARYFVGTPGAAYATVFAGEAVLFLIAAWLAIGVGNVGRQRPPTRFSSGINDCADGLERG